MISINFTQLDDSIKTFILSVAVGSDVIIDKLLQTVDRHLTLLESLKKDTPNVRLYFDCSFQIVNNAYIALRYINHNSADLFNDDPICPLESKLRSIEERFTSVLDRVGKEIFKGEV